MHGGSPFPVVEQMNKTSELLLRRWNGKESSGKIERVGVPLENSHASLQNGHCINVLTKLLNVLIADEWAIDSAVPVWVPYKIEIDLDELMIYMIV